MPRGQPELCPFCFARATGASDLFSDAGLASFSRILANLVLLPDVPGLLVAQCKGCLQLKIIVEARELND